MILIFCYVSCVFVILVVFCHMRCVQFCYVISVFVILLVFLSSWLFLFHFVIISVLVFRLFCKLLLTQHLHTIFIISLISLVLEIIVCFLRSFRYL